MSRSHSVLKLCENLLSQINRPSQAAISTDLGTVNSSCLHIYCNFTMKELSLAEELPDVNIAQEFYSKYEPKEVLGRYYFWMQTISDYKLVLNVWQWLFCRRRQFTLRDYFAVSYL